MSLEVQRVPHADVSGRGANPTQLVTAPEVSAPAADDIDGWIAVVEKYTWLSNQIANTDFPPAEMRGKPAAILAAFLTGREQGLGPMTSLGNLHVIKGKVGQSSHLMRALILAAGHELEYDETTDARCIARGRRRGESGWTRVEFTSQQARTAGITLGGYPEDKLVARATARLARRRFADVISGMAYLSEELADDSFEEDGGSVTGAPVTGTSAAGGSDEQGEAAKPTRTARRPASRARPTRPAPAATRNDTGSQQPAASSGPPLPGEEDDKNAPGDVTSTDVVSGRPGEGGRRDQARQPAQEPDGATAAGSGSSSPDITPAPPQAKLVTKNQLGKIGALFTEAKVSAREHRLRVCASMADRDIKSSTELTQDEASDLIGQLQDLGPDGIAAMADPKNAGEQGQLGDDEPVDAEVVEEQAGQDTADDAARADG